MQNPELESRIKDLSGAIDAGRPTAELHYRRGKLYWKAGKRAEAMTDFNAAVALDPFSPAAVYLKMACDIMDFYNTDLYNP